MTLSVFAIFCGTKPTYTIFKLPLEVIFNPPLCISLKSSRQEDQYAMFLLEIDHLLQSYRATAVR